MIDKWNFWIYINYLNEESLRRNFLRAVRWESSFTAARPSSSHFSLWTIEHWEKEVWVKLEVIIVKEFRIQQ